MYACHQDAHVYAYYSQRILDPKYEKILLDNPLVNQSVIAYRRLSTSDGKSNKNNVHFAKEVFDEIKKRENCIALLFDIENFFPSLDHKKLKKAWINVLGGKSLPKNHYNLYKSVTKYSFINLNDLKTSNGHFDEKELAAIRNTGKQAYFHSVKDFLDSEIKIYKNPKKDKGIPQGLPISALLANIYMYDFDNAICDELVSKKNVFYRRYSDDMIFLCTENQIEEIMEFVDNQIKKVELVASKDKAETIEFKKAHVGNTSRLQSTRLFHNRRQENFPLSYLGFEFYGYQTLLKSKGLSSFYREMKSAVARRNRRVEAIKERELKDELPLFKRKIYRLYSYQGEKTREQIFKQKNGKIRVKRYRGNFIRYALKSSEIMGAPEIRRQIRNHWRILQKTMKKYEFSNLKSN
jgi:hypothetical protein